MCENIAYYSCRFPKYVVTRNASRIVGNEQAIVLKIRYDIKGIDLPPASSVSIELQT